MLHLLDLIDYWTDQLELAKHRHDKTRVLVCGAVLFALRQYRQECRRF